MILLMTTINVIIKKKFYILNLYKNEYQQIDQKYF